MGYTCGHSKLQEIVTSENHIQPINETINGINRNTIYWHIDEKDMSADFSKYKMILSIKNAFDTWGTKFRDLGIDIRIKSTSDPSKAAFILKFRKNGDADLPERFDENTIAYNYLPTEGQNLDYGADMYLNDALNFAEMHKPEHFNLFAIVVHEIGHGLGLYHSEVQGDIMGPYYIGDNPVLITPDTDAGILKLYREWVTLPKKNPDSFIDFKDVFPTLKSIKKMEENSIVNLGNKLGLELTKKDLKLYNAKRLHDHFN